MKKLPLILLLVVSLGYSQENLESLIAAGLEDAKRFSTAYITPASEGVIFNLSNGWIQEAKVKKPLKFDFMVIGNASFIKDEHKSFVLNTSDYNNLFFRDGSTSKAVATAFGENNPDIMVYAKVTDDTGMFEEEVEFLLPQGLAAANMEHLPSFFLQGRLGIFKATELKVRYFPKVEYEDVKTGLLGGGIQHEFTEWLPGMKLLPVSISAFIGYTNLSSEYDFTNTNVVDGDLQRFEVTQNSWLFQLQASTKLPVINFYGGIGYVKGTSDFDVLGTYTVQAGTPLTETSSTFVDPFSIRNEVSGIKASLGTKLQLGFFGLYAEYNIAEFNTASAGVSFGI